MTDPIRAALERLHQYAVIFPEHDTDLIVARALAARPLLEQVARMGDRIGRHTVGEIMAISDRAAAWLRENPPGQPVAIEPRGCPTPGACSCVEPAPVPVSERLPGPEDCDAEGRYWIHMPNIGTAPSWRLVDPREIGPYHTHWLPAHALPLPAWEVE